MRQALIPSIAVLVIVVFAIVLMPARATTVSGPDLSGSCTNSGTGFNAAFTANTLSRVMAWQLNVTFSASAVAPMSYSVSNSFTSNSQIMAKNGTGYYMVGVAMNGGVTYSSSSTTTFFTLNFKTKVYHAQTLFDIATGGPFPSELFGSSFDSLSFNTESGYYGCNV
ncbi:hypothetical protein E6H20_06260 [Candidatus Bathyarchaeota archaeon]|nr:MAG: hypothetical protein E6H20_06260 [Candidatus Bathyarchaeota archaeon]